MYIESIRNRNSPPAVLLRESYRENGKVCKRTLANLSCLSDEVIDGLKVLLRGGRMPERADECVRAVLVEVARFADGNYANEADLRRGPDGFFRLAAGGAAPADPTVKVAAGYLEGSNVNVVEQMVSMISLARQYEMQTRMLSTAQEMDRSAGQLVAKG